MASGFRDTTKMKSGFSFPSSAGFTSSTGRVQNISYTRRTPMRKADGGEIKRPPVQRNPTGLPRRPMPAYGALEGLRRAIMPVRGGSNLMTDAAVARMDRKKGGKVMCKAEGGRVVDSGLQGRVPPTNEVDAESGMHSPLRPKFRRGGYASGGKNWIKSAIKHPGAFTAKAKRAGKSVAAYAKQVTKEGSHASTQTKRQAGLAKTLRAMHKAEGGAVRSDEAQDRPMMEKIAHKVVGEHVSRAAPTGHRGLGTLLKRGK